MPEPDEENICSLCGCDEEEHTEGHERTRRERDEARALVRKLRNAGRCHWRLNGGCEQHRSPDWKWCEWCRVAAEVDEGDKP